MSEVEGCAFNFLRRAHEVKAKMQVGIKKIIPDGGDFFAESGNSFDGIDEKIQPRRQIAM